MERKKSSSLLGTIAGTFPKPANVFSIQIERLTGTVFHRRYAGVFLYKMAATNRTKYGERLYCIKQRNAPYNRPKLKQRKKTIYFPKR